MFKCGDINEGLVKNDLDKYENLRLYFNCICLFIMNCFDDNGTVNIEINSSNDKHEDVFYMKNKPYQWVLVNNTSNRCQQLFNGVEKYRIILRSLCSFTT